MSGAVDTALSGRWGAWIDLVLSEDERGATACCQTAALFECVCFECVCFECVVVVGSVAGSQ